MRARSERLGSNARREDAERFAISDQAVPEQGPSERRTIRIGVQEFDETSSLLDVIRASLEFDSATDIVVIDLSGKSAIADYMVVASATSARLVGSICDKLIERLKTLRGAKPRAEGLEQGDWALIDAGDVIVHVFRPEVREYYALEKMWAPQVAAERKRSA